MTLTPEEMRERKEFAHRAGWRIFAIWLVLTVIGEILVLFVWGPHMPPGKKAKKEKKCEENIKYKNCTMR